MRPADRWLAAIAAVACVALAGLVVVSNSSHRAELFSIDDFESGRVNFPEPGLRSHAQVIKSLDTNLNLGDHKWEHQTHVSEAPMQEWPMTTAGMRGRKVQLSALPKVPKGLRALGKMNVAQQKAAKDLARVGRQLDRSVAPRGHFI